jgi:hypothetical protein
MGNKICWKARIMYAANETTEGNWKLVKFMKTITDEAESDIGLLIVMMRLARC